MSNLHQVLGKTLAYIAQDNPNIVALSGDVRHSTGLGIFAENFPDRYFEMGISEQNMIGVAAGMALEGKIPFVATYACFSPGRTWEQIRNSICLQNANVKIIGCHIGFGPARDGATHQCFEDIALMRCLPNIKIFSPFDDYDCRNCVANAVNHQGPVYLRLSRQAADCLSKSYKSSFEQLNKGHNIAVIATGAITEKALKAAKKYNDETQNNAAVFSCSCLKPLDTNLLKQLAQRFTAIITVEEHQIFGGFGSAVAETLSECPNSPIIYRLGMPDSFGASGYADELYSHFGLDEDHIFNKILQTSKEIALC